METESPAQCQSTVTVRRNPHRKARPTPQIPIPSSSNLPEIRSFPIHDILSIEIPQNPHSDISSVQDPISENLKVYLRIRPLVPLKGSGNFGVVRDQNSRPAAKNAWPQNPAKKNADRERNATKKKKISEICVTVNDSRSVTLSPPSSLQESKRIKSEVYEGFSHVFSAQSSQDEVYEKMVNPLVEDFLKGKSGMLAALGQSGSGKTHTVFGSPRNPGMVPLAVRQIFDRIEGSNSESSRTICISMFEIYSERGKGEKVFDLVTDQAELSVSKSTAKGFHEVVVSNVAQAESLLAIGMLKRTTAMTNENSQSSRSQCVINIHSVANKLNGEVDVQSNNVVLTIVDLAGAEREKKTGNQGVRLLESNSINNTSMVFGLCLRSLLEHQKNPKKPLQKHFQNSLLTRYLRDYMEGKKRMALILTVKSGEEDYLDTSFLLRQASPYMKIKFNNVKEASCNKRNFQVLPRIEQSKRMKFSTLDASAIEEAKSAGDENQLCEEEVPSVYNLDVNDSAPLKSNCVDLAKRERESLIMQGFAKAMWKVLKQYKEKLEVTENEVKSLRENIESEKTRYLKLEEELKDMKSHCTCFKDISVDGALPKLKTDFNSEVNSLRELEGHESCNADETNLNVHTSNVEASYCNSPLKKCDPTLGQDQDVHSQDYYKVIDPDDLCIKEFTHQNCEVHVETFYSDMNDFECVGNKQESDPPVTSFDVDNASSVHLIHNLQNYPKFESFPMDGNKPEDLNELKHLTIDVDYPASSRLSESVVHASQSLSIISDDSCPSVELDQLLSEEDKESPDHPQSPKEGVAFTEGCSVVNVLDNDQRIDSARKQDKPKRRLLPASSVLLRDISTLDVEDEIEKPKGSKCGQKLAANESKRTQGSINLLRMLRSNLHL